MVTVADLQYGQKGIIKDFTEHILPIKLLELGCLPGNSVELLQIAPLNDPIYINLSGSHLAIRRSLAALIELEIIEETQAK
ncbi:MAG TPA: ferrous iron transport protein A [Muricauda sp.]|uniref:Ferrous iron transport protein A n=2 Tax=Flagellimonas TaxID=444459 RepID=A0ABS7EQ37_9FLAO|nr:MULTISPECIES: FeoA family protein [Allomuricauda]MAO18845.1 ferrous iron transport protein A [Allomuricauda sp.]MBO0353036.1 ferrous iron transport protein A [Allomuricauda aurea]MBW8199174.1 ferrous iron transport protein A [Allomuricauda abyssi]HBU78243.1 ferrous iron transport protein A [Allomuricauda sp.]